VNAGALVKARLALLWVMLLSVLVSVGMICLWIIIDEPFGEYVMVGFLLLAAFSFTALLCVNMLCRSRYVALMWVGVAASALAFLVWQPVAMIEWWRINFNEKALTVAGTVFTVTAAWCALFAALRINTWINRLSQVVMVSTLSLAAVIALMTIVIVIDEPRDDTFWGMYAIFCLLAACGLLASLALSLMSRVRTAGSGETISGKVVVQLVCPRCRSEQGMRTGLSRCTSCGLRIELIVEEPVCECGYQLYQLTGDRCPECGREIPDGDRWGAQMESLPPSEGGDQGAGAAHAAP